MSTKQEFQKTSSFPGSLEALEAFHKQPAAFKKLTLPPLFVQLLRDDRESLTSGELEFRLWFGPLPIVWLARHEEGPTPHSFIDRMLRGPAAEWVHQHIFEPAPDGVRLIDRITFRHGRGIRGLISRLLFNPLSLHFLFAYRHWVTRRALAA